MRHAGAWKHRRVVLVELLSAKIWPTSLVLNCRGRQDPKDWTLNPGNPLKGFDLFWQKNVKLSPLLRLGLLRKRFLEPRKQLTKRRTWIVSSRNLKDLFHVPVKLRFFPQWKSHLLTLTCRMLRRKGRRVLPILNRFRMTRSIKLSS